MCWRYYVDLAESCDLQFGVERKQNGTISVLRLEAINYNKKNILTDSEHCQPSHFGFNFHLRWLF